MRNKNNTAIFFLWLSSISLGSLVLTSCMANKNQTNSSFNSVLLENSSKADIYSTGEGKEGVTKSFGKQTSVMLKFAQDNPTSGIIKLSLPTHDQDTGQTVLRELSFKTGLKTTVFLTSVDTKNKLSRSTISQQNLKITCQFTTYLNANSQIANALEAFGRPINGSFGLRNNSSMMYTSLSFVAPSPHTPKGLLQQCQEHYKRDFQEKNQDDLIGLAGNMAFSFPKQRCEPSKGSLTAQHDDQCIDWFNVREHLHSKRVVARCTTILGAANDRGFCVALTQSQSPCPIFLDKYHKYTDKPEDSISAIKTSLHKTQFLCDEIRNLRCKARSKAPSGALEGYCQ